MDDCGFRSPVLVRVFKLRSPIQLVCLTSRVHGSFSGGRSPIGGCQGRSCNVLNALAVCMVGLQAPLQPSASSAKQSISSCWSGAVAFAWVWCCFLNYFAIGNVKWTEAPRLDGSSQSRPDRVPASGVTTARPSRSPAGPGRSSCHCGQLDDWIIAQRRNRFQAHVASALNGPFIFLFEQQRADGPRYRAFVGEDADDIGAALELAVEAFQRIDGVDF
jgi:hypothetical protein